MARPVGCIQKVGIAFPGNGWRVNGFTGNGPEDAEKSPERSARVGTVVPRVTPWRTRRPS